MSQLNVALGAPNLNDDPYELLKQVINNTIRQSNNDIVGSSLITTIQAIVTSSEIVTPFTVSYPNLGVMNVIKSINNNISVSVAFDDNMLVSTLKNLGFDQTTQFSITYGIAIPNSLKQLFPELNTIGCSGIGTFNGVDDVAFTTYFNIMSGVMNYNDFLVAYDVQLPSLVLSSGYCTFPTITYDNTSVITVTGTGTIKPKLFLPVI